MPLPYKLGSNGAEVLEWGKWFAKKYASYAAPADGYYGYAERDAVSELQRRLGIPVTGVFDELTAAKSGYKALGGGTPQTGPYRPIWFYSAPGSGAPWHIGPAFDTGEWVKKTFNLNHQPVGYPIGGYLGFMGGDPGLSYNDVITAEKVELARLIRTNPDLKNPNVEFWFSGYSQSADGMRRALAELFGNSGEFAHLRPRINGVINFGDPSRHAGRTKVGNTPKGSGIARYTAPQWLEDLTWSISSNGDFYSACDDTIRPLFYEWFIKAETELPFVIYTGQIIIPALLNLVAPFLGGIASPLASGILSGATGLGGGLINSMLGGISSSSEPPNPELVKLLSVQGVLTNLPQLIKLVASLGGLQEHGNYSAPRPEFGNRSGVMVACDIVKDFRR